MPEAEKTEKMMTPTEAAQFLRSLADNLERGQMDFGEVMVDLDSPFKVKQSVKAKGDRVSFKLKLKYEKHLLPVGGSLGTSHPLLDHDDDEDEAEDSAQEKASFKKLKKAMAGPWKQIKQSLVAGELPQLELVQGFCAQCQTMTGYQGKGEEYYAVFLEQAERLLTCVEQGSLEQAQEAMTALEAQKKACHQAHK